MSGPTADGGTVARKRLLRARARSLREALGADAIAEWSAAIRRRLCDTSAIRGAGTVFCYLSIGREVDTRALIDDLVAAGKRVLVPSIVGRGHMEACPFRGWSRLRAGPLGIPAPAGEPPWTDAVDVALVPGVAFDIRGRRLGLGAGYYDRWLAAHAVGARIGLAFEIQILADLPADAYDQQMDLVVTERRVLQTRARAPTTPPAPRR